MLWRNKFRTGKQDKFIEAIEKELNEPFTGCNRGEASDYIDKWYDKFYESKEKNRDGRAPTGEAKVVHIQDFQKKDKLYLACERIKFENDKKEKMKYKLFWDKEEAVDFIIKSILCDMGVETFEEYASAMKNMREIYNKNKTVSYSGDGGDLDDNHNWIADLFEVEYHVEELELPLQQSQQPSVEKNIETTDTSPKKKKCMYKKYTSSTSKGCSSEIIFDETAQKLFDAMDSTDIDNAKRLYHAYQYEYLILNNISIYEIIDMIEERQISRMRRFGKKTTVKEAFESFDKQGTGAPGHEPWDMYEDFCSEYIFSSDKSIFDLIESMYVTKDEKEKLEEWVQNCKDDYDNANEAIEDDVDDDWLGPHPEETWSDLYEKD